MKNKIPATESIVSFFYVFADDSTELVERDKSPKKSISRSETNQQTIDDEVIEAFQKISRSLSKEAKVTFNPNDTIRKMFGILNLPAFGISDLDLEIVGDKWSEKPTEIPSMWNPFAMKKRRKLLNSGKYLPRIQREIIEVFETSEKLFLFIRDLHMYKKEFGLPGVNQKIEDELRKLGASKILKLATIGKTIFFR